MASQMKFHFYMKTIGPLKGVKIVPMIFGEGIFLHTLYVQNAAQEGSKSEINTAVYAPENIQITVIAYRPIIPLINAKTNALPNM